MRVELGFGGSGPEGSRLHSVEVVQAGRALLGPLEHRHRLLPVHDERVGRPQRLLTRVLRAYGAELRRVPSLKPVEDVDEHGMKHVDDLRECVSA